jgi:uncharacterized membrane protein YjgN (DUF898 family)
MMPSAIALKASFAAEPVLDVARQLFAADSVERTPQTAAVAPLVSAADPPAVTVPAVTVPAVTGPAVTGPAVTWIEPKENLWLLSLQSFGLTLMTFGVYHFWGRAESRRRTTNAVHVNGKPLDHTGTGLEAFVSFALGALIAVSITTAFYLMMQGAPGTGIEGMRQIRWQRLTISLPLLFLLGSIVYRKRQHILRRTWLDGQRFDLSGHAWGYAVHHFWMAFLVPLTLGWAAPWRASRLEAMKIRDMHFGGVRFHAKTNVKPLYKAFALLWFGGGFLYFTTLVVLSLNIGPQLLSAINGLSAAPLNDADVLRRGLTILACGCAPLSLFVLVYRRAMLEHQVSSVAFDGGQLSLKLPLLGYVWLAISNVALKVGSFGAFAPVADARAMRYMIRHLKVEGRLPQV